MIIHIENKEQFINEISKGKCLVDFYTSWCGPCKMLSPIIEELDQENKLDGAKVLKIDCDEVRDLAIEFRIQAVPTLMLFVDGKPIKTSTGYLNENELINFIK